MLRFALQNERTSAPIISSLPANIGKLRLFAKKKSWTSEHFPAHRFPRLATAVFSDGALDPVIQIRVSS